MSHNKEVPKEIKEAIRECAKYSKIAYKYNTIIRNWLEDNNLGDDDAIRNPLIDSVEMSGSDPEGFIKYLELYLKGVT